MFRFNESGVSERPGGEALVSEDPQGETLRTWPLKPVVMPRNLLDGLFSEVSSSVYERVESGRRTER